MASFDTSQVLRYDDTQGAFLGVFATTLADDHPIGMKFGPNGQLYVSVNNFSTAPQQSFIRRFDAKTGALIDSFASGTSSGHFAFGPDGNLYVPDFGPGAVSKVSRFNATTGAFIDDFVPAGLGELRGAESVTFGPDGNLYVTSRITNQVLRYQGTTGAFLGVFATGGQNGPIDLTFGPDGQLYVLNSSGGALEVLRFNGVTGIFRDVFVSATSGSTDGSSLAFGPDGNLYVTTGLNNSVRRFDGRTGQPLADFVTSGSGGLSFATGLLFTGGTPLSVSIDIEPGLLPNTVNLKSRGTIPVAVLGSASFDVTQVDAVGVRFGPSGAMPVKAKTHLVDIDADGDLDLVLHFKIQKTGLRCGETSASLQGATLEGRSFTASDAIKTKGCR